MPAGRRKSAAPDHPTFTVAAAGLPTNTPQTTVAQSPMATALPTASASNMPAATSASIPLLKPPRRPRPTNDASDNANSVETMSRSPRETFRGHLKAIKSAAQTTKLHFAITVPVVTQDFIASRFEAALATRASLSADDVRQILRGTKEFMYTMLNDELEGVLDMRRKDRHKNTIIYAANIDTELLAACRAHGRSEGSSALAQTPRAPPMPVPGPSAPSYVDAQGRSDVQPSSSYGPQPQGVAGPSNYRLDPRAASQRRVQGAPMTRRPQVAQAGYPSSAPTPAGYYHPTSAGAPAGRPGHYAQQRSPSDTSQSVAVYRTSEGQYVPTPTGHVFSQQIAPSIQGYPQEYLNYAAPQVGPATQVYPRQSPVAASIQPSVAGSGQYEGFEGTNAGIPVQRSAPQGGFVPMPQYAPVIQSQQPSMVPTGYLAPLPNPRSTQRRSPLAAASPDYAERASPAPRRTAPKRKRARDASPQPEPVERPAKRSRARGRSQVEIVPAQAAYAASPPVSGVVSAPAGVEYAPGPQPSVVPTMSYAPEAPVRASATPIPAAYITGALPMTPSVMRATPRSRPSSSVRAVMTPVPSSSSPARSSPTPGNWGTMAAIPAQSSSPAFVPRTPSRGRLTANPGQAGDLLAVPSPGSASAGTPSTAADSVAVLTPGSDVGQQAPTQNVGGALIKGDVGGQAAEPAIVGGDASNFEGAPANGDEWSLFESSNPSYMADNVFTDGSALVDGVLDPSSYYSGAQDGSDVFGDWVADISNAPFSNDPFGFGYS